MQIVESSGWQMKQKHHSIFNVPLISICVVLINLCTFPVFVYPFNFYLYMNYLSQYHIYNNVALFLSPSPQKINWCFKHGFAVEFSYTCSHVKKKVLTWIIKFIWSSGSVTTSVEAEVFTLCWSEACRPVLIKCHNLHRSESPRKFTPRSNCVMSTAIKESLQRMLNVKVNGLFGTG